MSNKRKLVSDDENESDTELNDSQINYDEDGCLRCDDIYVPPPPRPPGTIDTTGPRLMITKIVNTNFKSYGEVQMLGPFHHNFNAIVGPNGSGKSNVIDSLLFVFGYRASKIRSKKLSVLLHKSEKYPNVQACTVAIHFCKILDKDVEPGYDIIPKSDFVVSRTANKDNSSFYLHNGSRMQYRNIATLLRTHGVDLDHNRFLILQGEVEQISLMKPKAQTDHDTGMLEYLEDIIGTTRFKNPLNKIGEKIDHYSDLRTEVANRVNLAEKEKDDLEGPMQEAVQFLKDENEVIKKKHFLFQRQIKQLEDKIEDNERKKGLLTGKCQEYNDELSNLTAEKKTLTKSYAEHTKQFEDLHLRKEQLTEAFNKANNKDINIQAEMVEVNKQRKQLIEQLKQETAKIETNKKLPAKNLGIIEEYEARAQKLATEHEALEAKKTELLSSLRDETVDLQKQKETLQNNLAGFRKIVDETKSAFKVAESDLKIYRSTEDIQREKLETLKTKYECNTQKITDEKQQLKELKQRIPLAEKQLRDLIQNLEKVQIEEAKSIQELKVKRVQIEESRSSMQASRSRGRVLDFLTRQKEEGNLEGLFGRLGDLGAINQRYDVAISTACGDLDNIVVDTVDTAQRAIELLKSHNVGRGTFIALDKQEGLRHQANTQIKTPENVPRLYDLVQVEDERVKTAFYYALRNTLVANDIEQATRIAYGAQRYRVVSLKGDVIEMSGTMAGGGKTVFRGRMGQSVATSNISSPRKIADMETILQRLESKITELHQKQKTIEEEVNTLQPELNKMKIDFERFTMEVQYLQQGQSTLAEQLKKQERIYKESSVNPAVVKKLEIKMRKTQTEFEEANKKSEIIQKEVDAVKNEIEDIKNKKMKDVNKKLKDCSETLEKFKIELNKLKLAIKTAERVIKTCQNKITNYDQDKTECETKLLAFQVERKEIEKDAAVLMEHLKKITNELNEGEAEFAEEKKSIDKLTEQLNKLKSEKMELDLKISEFDNVVTGCTNNKKHLESMLSQLKYHEIPDEVEEPFQEYTYEQLIETDTKQMEINLKRDEERLKAVRPNLTAIKNYKKKHAMFLERVNDLSNITTKRTEMREFRELLRLKRQSEFRAGFNLISSKLKEMYQLITLGGDAELELVDSYDPFQEGIILNVRPPKKSWKNIINLSGGEKTLSSLALVFALHYYKPSPLYFMDEIDAALDFKNVSIVGNYIKERTKNAQFIIISLRSNMFELADHLVGIYKTFNITKSITIAPQKIHALPLPTVTYTNQMDIDEAPLSQNADQCATNEDDNVESNHSFSTDTSTLGELGA